MSRHTPAALCAIVTLALGALVGCSGSENESSQQQTTSSSSHSTTGEVGSGVSVYATTGYLADAVANIAPGAEVTTMVGPGGDPHTYQPSTQDIEKIHNADLVFWNGLHLEAMMIDQLESLGDKQLAVGDQLPEKYLLPWPETDSHGKPLHDPHIWNNPEGWQLVVNMVADKFAEYDPDNAQAYQDNAKAYNAKIDALAKSSQEKLAAIPAEKRILITGHDAFNYFGKYFNLEVHATDFVSSEAKLDPAELSALADTIAKAKLPVIFQDNLANPQAIASLKEAVESRGWKVEISNAELYADSLGEAAPVNTYLGVLEHNVTTIAQALATK
ncbi:metal ABC transporter substrate-binding protein [Trueperella sp. LYQ143]|uniref:metal ABC transporter substrate-binding protein n=1 Tax=unclassified Trueperella TaxID=2630174 RepID=UPI003983C297